MTSNFLGDVMVPGAPSSILSGSELIAREGVNLSKGMNFRDRGELLSVFLVLQHDGVFKDEWHAKTNSYVYHGHDSTTKETGGKSKDQLLMYADGKLTENGKFFKAANALGSGVRKEPLQIQVYEKLDAGLWFDKGIFNLRDAKKVSEEGRNVYKFYLEPLGAKDKHHEERILSAQEKAIIWERCKGRCSKCKEQKGLRFAKGALLCAIHRGEGGLLG